MALSSSALALAIKNAIIGIPAPTASTTADAYLTSFSNALAGAIDTYVKTAVVTVPLGVAVQTVPATGTGATTAPGIGTLS